MIKLILKQTFIVATLFLFSNFTNAQATFSVQNAEFDTCGETLPSTELNLGNILFSEALVADFSIGTYTFFIQAPSNFEIDASLANFTGTDISSVTVAQAIGNSSRLEVTITVDGDSSVDALTLQNVRIHNTTGAVTTNGQLSYVLDGNTNNINDFSDGDVLSTVLFNQLSGGVGVNQELCATADVQNISVQESNITQNRSFEWEVEDNGTFVPVPDSATEVLVIDNSTFPNGISRYRRSTTTTVNGEACVLYSTVAEITVNEIYPGSITEGTGQNVCASETPDQLSTTGDVAVTVGGTAVFQWYMNDSGTWEEIAGATETFYQPGPLTQTTSFRRRITNTLNGVVCFEETSAVSIVVNSVVAGGTATDQNICTLNELQLLTINNGESNADFQWQKNNADTWEDIAGANQSFYDASNNLSGGISEFRRISTVSGASCEGISTVATITFADFSVGSIGGGETICYDETPQALLSNESASGSGTISYQWESSVDNGVSYSEISGATSEIYEPGNLQQTTVYRRSDAVTLNGFTCDANTNEVTITVLDEIPGGDASADQTVCKSEVPSTITVSNGTTAGANISYQWQSKTNGDFANITGENGESLSFTTTPSTTTDYRRQTVTTDNSQICTSLSTESTVFVNTISAGIIGSNQDICSGESVDPLLSLSSANAEGTISYQWEFSEDNGTTYANVASATNATYAPTGITTTTLFRRLDSSALNGETCSEYTNAVTITVAGVIDGGTGAPDQTVCEDEVPTTLIIAGGTETAADIDFQWFSSLDDLSYDIIPGETSENLMFSSGLEASTYFKREVTRSTGTTTCSTFSTPTLVTLISLSAGEIAATQTVCGDANVATITSAVDPVSNGTVSYEWETSIDGDTWSTVAGADQSTYTPPITDDLVRFFRRKAISDLNGTSCEATTDPVIVYVNRFENEDSHEIQLSGSATICNGGDPAAFTVNFTLLASGDITYQWQSSSDNITFSDIGGATNALFDPPMVTADIYYRRITTSTLNGVVCTVTSNVLFLENGGNATAGSIDTTNDNGTTGDNQEVVCNGDVPSAIIEIDAAVSSGTITYSWTANGSLISGATDKDYTPTDPITETTVYTRIVTSENIDGDVCTVNTNSVTILVPQGDYIGEDVTICSGDTPPELGDLSAIEGISFLDFQWYDSTDGVTFSLIVGATDATYDYGTPLTATRYFRRGYTATVDGRVCGPERLSNIVQIIINEVTGGTVSEDQDICFGEDPAQLNNVDNGTASGVLSYQWYSSIDNTTWNVIDGANNANHDPQASDAPTTYFRRTTISELNGVSCSEDSNTVTVFIADELDPGILTADQTVCDDETPDTLTVAGGSTFSDQVISWFSSPDDVVWTDIGVSTASYSPPVLTETTFYKRRISRDSFGSLSCIAETNSVEVTLNAVVAGTISGDQSVCEGGQPETLIGVNPVSGSGDLTFQWFSSPDNVAYAQVAGAAEANYLPPTTLTTSTYFKRRTTSSLNGVDCFKETSPVLVTVIPYPIIDSEAIVANDVTDVGCFGGTDGSIIVPNERITGGNNAQEQISTITLFGTPEFGSTYSIIIDGVVYEHEVTLNGSNVTETNDEIVVQLTNEINNASGSRLSPAIATTNANELLLTAKIAGVGFTAFASTNSTSGAGASSVITQENVSGNTYEWTKTGDGSFSASTLSISDLTAGVYFLTVFNEFCSVTSDPILVSEPDELTLEIGDTCNTALTATSTGGIAPFTFTLTRPDSTTLVSTSNNTMITYTGLTGGATYSVSVEGATCSIPVSESVTLPFGLQFDETSVVVNNLSCFESNDGSISLNNGATTVTGGTAPYNFSWEGPGGATFNTENINNLVPGVYVLMVTDQIGCSATYTTNIASKQALEITSAQLVNEQLKCAGDMDAEIGIQISSDSNAQLQINWFRNGTSFVSNSTNLTNLGPGSYEVVVTDTNGDTDSPCEVRQSFEITAPEVFTAAEVSSETSSSCYDPSGQRDFVVLVSGGTAPYQYQVDMDTPVLFSTEQTTISGLNNDAHIIAVTDSNTCETISFILEALQPIAYSGTTDFTIAACEENFAFELDTDLITGGNPFTDTSGSFYLYEWRGPNGFVAQDITSFDAEAGSYFLTVLDADDCNSEEIEFTFSPTFDAISVESTITEVSCGAEGDGAISISISGGNRPYTIVWEQESAGNSTNGSASFTVIGNNVTQLNNLSEGRLRLTVTSNISGCNDSNADYYYQEIFTINKEDSLQLVDGPHLDDALCAGQAGFITLDIFNEIDSDLSFYYNGDLVSATEVSANTYQVQIASPLDEAELNVLNDRGCGFTTSVSTGVAAPSFTVTSDEADITGLLLVNEDVRFTNTTETGYTFVTYDFGDGTATVDVFPDEDGIITIHNYSFAGVFDASLTVFNSSGCSDTIVQTVQIGSGFDVIFPNVFSPNSDGINDYFEGEFTGIASFTFQIYDIWGGLVYTVSYDLEDLPENWGWDGNYTNGKLFENLTFRYVFTGKTGNDTQITRTGEATIRR